MRFLWRDFARLEALALEAQRPRGARFRSDATVLDVEFYAPGIVRLWAAPADGDRPARPDYGLLAATPVEGDPVTVTSAAGGYRLQAGDTALELAPSPLRLQLVHKGRRLLRSAHDHHISGPLRLPPLARRDARWLVGLELPSGAPVYGLGEKFGPLDRRGQLVTSWNEDAWGVNTETSYKNIPFCWSPGGWGVFVHTTARVAHGVGYPQWSHRSYVLRVDDATLDVFLLAADEPAELLERFTWLVGRPPAPPRWSFGVWMSRCYYRTAEEALGVARRLRERRIPCDVLVLDGRAWLRVDTRFEFAWDPARYPDPQGFTRELARLDLRLCLWEYPYVSVKSALFAELAARGHLLRTAGGDPYVFRWDPEPSSGLLTPLPDSAMVDFTNQDAYAWYRDAHRPLFAQGATVMKTDFGEQVPEDAVASNGDTGERLHNVYPVLYNRCVYEATERYGKDGAMVWGRSGWTGSQRYPIQWGGDPQADWEGLAASIRGGLSWGLSGAAYYAHDIGGFYGPSPSPELYVRWVQAGVMSSHTRFHGTTPREPWEFGEEAERITREWLRWRYRLVPYLEACAQAARRTGLPVARAMPLAFPGEPAAWAFEEQYLLGPALLVAPILTPGGRVRLYVPEGSWYDLASGVSVTGPRVLTRTVPLDEMPLYGREGYALPLGPAVDHTGQIGTEWLEELWTFGIPQHGVTGPGFSVGIAGDGAKSRIAPLSPGVRIRAWGPVQVERDGSAAVVRRSSTPLR